MIFCIQRTHFFFFLTHPGSSGKIWWVRMFFWFYLFLSVSLRMTVCSVWTCKNVLLINFAQQKCLWYKQNESFPCKILQPCRKTTGTLSHHDGPEESLRNGSSLQVIHWQWSMNPQTAVESSTWVFSPFCIVCIKLNVLKNPELGVCCPQSICA